MENSGLTKDDLKVFQREEAGLNSRGSIEGYALLRKKTSGGGMAES